MSSPASPPLSAKPSSDLEPWFSTSPTTDTQLAFPSWYSEMQQAAWERYRSLPQPTRKQERWRFADLKKVRFTELTAAKSAENPQALIDRAIADRASDFAAHFVFANNQLIHSEVAELPSGTIVLPINEALASHPDLVRKHFLQEQENLGGEIFAALHASATLSGLFVHFSKGAICEKPIVVHHFAGGEMQTVFPHTLVVAEENAFVSVVDTFESIDEGEHSLVVGMVDLAAETGAQIQYVAMQDESDSGAKHVQLNSNRVGRDAKVKAAFINLGAAWVRAESINRMTGNGSDCQVYSANLCNGIQEYDQRTLQSHEAEHTYSDLLFKNALYDESRTIFSGLIQVQEGAHHTDSYQTCRNLLGSEKAEANSMPGLEIGADQVKCSHGSTSGQISEEEIFYLEARGIPAEAARRMISLGFLNESIQKLRGDELKQSLFDKVERKFAAL